MTKSKRRGPRCWAGALAVLAVTLGGCASLLPEPPPEPYLHVLAAAPGVEATGVTRDVVLEVGTPRAAPGFDTPRIAYVRKPFEVDYFALHRWADAPARMIAPLLARALERSGAFRAVVEAPSSVAADLRVDVALDLLQQDFSVQPSRVELALRVQLVDLRARTVLATRTFRADEPAGSEDADGGVAAANAALARVLAQVVAFCVAESGGPRPSAGRP
jgi:cholesterol transport system auxiliary component